MARAALNLAGMNLDQLLSLRAKVDKYLSAKRRELEAQLSRITSGDGAGPAKGRPGRPSAGVRTSSLRGKKVPPKFRGPGGETWAGRGAQPRWLVALLKQGKKLEDFAIRKATAARRGTATKKSRRRK